MKARFFCEKCGAEVSEGARSCPSCGSLFGAVRCPECGYQGKPSEFISGCPVCGYSAPLSGQVRSQPPRDAPRARGRASHPFSSRFYATAAIVLGIIAVVLLVILLRGR